MTSSSFSSGNNYTFKVTIGNETRRFSLPKKCTSWHTLCAVLWSSFQNLNDNQNDLVLYYRDNDHDVITLSSDMELTELLRQPEAVSSNSVIRLYGERRQDDGTMAWVFAPEEDTMMGHYNHGDNTSTPHLEKVNQVDNEQQQQPVLEAEQQRDPFAATFEQLGQLMDRFRDTIQDNPEVMRVMSQMASTITTSISNNTRINLTPLEEWLQSLSQPQHPSENLYPMPSERQEEEEDIFYITRLDDHDPPRYEEPTEPYPLYDTKPAAAESSTRAGDDTMFPHHHHHHHHPPPPPPPPPPPAPAPMFMESSLYPPPPPFIGPLWSRVLRTVGSSLGWNNGPPHYNAARYYSPPIAHHPPPPPPPMPMHPPPPPPQAQMPLPPPRRWNSDRRHHHHHNHHQRRDDHRYPSLSAHDFEYDNRWDHHHPHGYYHPHSGGKHYHRHQHHPPSMPPPSFAPFGTAAASSSSATAHHQPWYNDHHECRHTRSELKRMRKQERKERHQLRKERRAEKKRLRKEKRKSRRQARKDRRRGDVMDGYDSSTSTSSSSSSSSSSSDSSSMLSLSDDDHAHEELAYRVERLRVNNNDPFNKPAVDINKEKKQQ